MSASSAPFAASAAILSGIAARALGWPPDLFWNATPAELAMSLALPAADPSAPAPLGRADLLRLIESENDGRN
ncbi:phage tail assembly chaperone [Altererythrobacter sp. FM1]|nr:phage tail assembly chaperone [Altererythrobacter sp. FM1]